MNSGCVELSVKSACEYLKESNNYLIVTHSSPDGDTIGSGFALKNILNQLGKNANVVCADSFPQKFDFIVDENTDFTPENIIAVDIADLKLTTVLAERLENKVDLCIDHHISNTHFAKRLVLDASAAACCEIILKIAEELSVVINQKLANAIYTGICTDTGCFKFSNVTENTHLSASKLIKCGAETAKINRIMFETKRREQIELEKSALETLKFYYGQKCALIYITTEMMKKTGCLDSELDAISSVPRTIEGVLVGITLKQKDENLFKASVRTHAPIDAGKICAMLGGGGHARAAGCAIKGNLEEVSEKILSAAKTVLGEI